MKTPKTPPNEHERLVSLDSLEVLDSVAEERFDRITRLAKAMFDVPIALISLVDEKRQWFKSRQGLTACETPRSISFCGHAILGEDTLWVGNALEDERFHDNPLVTGELGIRFYAGYPLKDRQGNRLGTLCVIDQKPRARAAADIEILEDLGKVAEGVLSSLQLGNVELKLPEFSQEERKERIDGVTGVWNKMGIREILEHAVEDCVAKERPATILLAEVEAGAELRETWGESGNDMVLAEIAQVLRSSIQGYDSIGRTSEDQFLLFLTGLSTSEVAEQLATYQKKLDENPVLQSVGVGIQFGFACTDEESAPTDVEGLLEIAMASVAEARKASRPKVAA